MTLHRAAAKAGGRTLPTQRRFTPLLRVRRPAITLLAGFILVIASACSSSGATSGAAAGSGVAGATAGPSTGSNATPQLAGGSFAGDPALAAKFPKVVDGQPVTNVTTARFVDFLTALGSTQAEIDPIKTAMAAVGIDLNTVIMGSATATVSGSPIGIQAFRIPGKDANVLIQNYALFATTNAGDVLSKETVGGKNATVVRSSTGFASTWMYANGDTLWSLSTSDQKEAEAVFSALA